MKPILPPAALLSRMLSAAPLLRGDYLASMVRNVSARDHSPSLTLSRSHLVRAKHSAESDGPACLPWEEPIYAIEGAIATVDIKGPLYKGIDDITCYYYGLASYDRIQEACRILATSAAQVIIFHIDSPGGMCTGCPETAELIAALSEAGKLTIAYTDNQCCSAAYWLASQCRQVVASPSSQVGCIGTYLAFYSYVEYLKQEGVELHLFRAGDLKGIGVFGKELTPAESAFLDAGVQRSNARFISAVLSRRPGVSADTMQGQWFDGDEARLLSLTDATISTLSELRDQLVTVVTPSFAPQN